MCKKAILVFFILFTFIPAAYLYAFTPDQERQLFQILGEIKGELRQINKRIEEVNTSLSKRIDDTNKRIEEVNTSLSKRIDDTNRRIEEVNRSLNERIDKLIDIMIGITATFAGLVGAMMGLVFWDRKTLITKAKEETIKEIEKEGRLKDLICALRKLAKNDQKLAEVLQQFNLL
jgi:tetrahydromethanopterin S-methyltransferase subunit G